LKSPLFSCYISPKISGSVNSQDSQFFKYGCAKGSKVVIAPPLPITAYATILFYQDLNAQDWQLVLKACDRQPKHLEFEEAQQK
jgi:hypothetical protein